MNKVLTLACLLFFLNAANLKAQNLNIIPLPESIEMGEGHLVLKEGSVIAAKTESSRKSAAIFNEMLEAKTGLNLLIQIAPQRSDALVVLEEIQDAQNEEGYSLNIDGNKIHIKGSSKGIFYGLQSLYQLVEMNGGQAIVPQLVINDAPAFGYRGIMLDVSRHFIGTDQVKKYLI